MKSEIWFYLGCVQTVKNEANIRERTGEFLFETKPQISILLIYLEMGILPQRQGAIDVCKFKGFFIQTLHKELLGIVFP